MSGIETTKHVRQLLPDTLVIGLSAVDEDALISEILHAGACTFVNKNSVARDLIGQIRHTIISWQFRGSGRVEWH